MQDQELWRNISLIDQNIQSLQHCHILGAEHFQPHPVYYT